MYTLLVFFVGVFTIGFLPALPNAFVFIALISCCFLGFFKPLRLPAVFCLGAVYGSVFGFLLLQGQLPKSLDRHIFVVTGYVEGLPEYKPMGQQQRHRFQLRLQSIVLAENQAQVQGLVSRKILLSWYQPLNQAAVEIQPGQLWQLRVKLKRPRGFVNPGGFDYQLWLLQQGVMARGYVRQDEHNALLSAHCTAQPIDCWRLAVRDKLTGLGEGLTSLGPLLALAMGDRSLVSADHWQLFKQTGTAHLMAISGLHIGLAAGFGFVLGGVLIRVMGIVFRAEHQWRWLPDILSLTIAATYSLLAGLSLPTQRALLMLALAHIARFLFYPMNPWLLLCLALGAISLLDPLAATQSGFWLSFVAVAVLIYHFHGYSERGPLNWKQRSLLLVKTQCLLSLAMVPLGLIFLQGLSLVGPVANLIAVPVLSFVIVPLLFLSMLLLLLSRPAAESLLKLTDTLFTYLLDGLQWLNHDQSGFYEISTGPLSLLPLVLAGLGIILLLSPKGLRIRYLGLCCLLPLCFPPSKPQSLRVSFLEVGQGTAVVVQTADHLLVYDTGRRFSERFDSGQHIVAPYLLQQRYKGIDTLVISHGDGDHAGGAQGLLSLLPAKHILAGEPDRTGGKQCIQGEQWQWDGVHFEVVWPDAESVGAPVLDNSNNASCVLLIRWQDKTVLLAGDIEASVEKKLLSRLPAVDVLLVPHHGSRSSSHEQWVNHLRPRFSVFSAAYKNSYGHPHKTVVERYRRIGSTILLTSESGAIRLSASPQRDWALEKWRQNHARYWYDL